MVKLTPISAQQTSWIIEFMRAHYPPAYEYLWEDAGDWYLRNMYSVEKIAAEFLDPNAGFYQVTHDNVVHGYCKVIAGKSPTHPGQYSNYFYLQRLYLAAEAQGKGIGLAVMQQVIEDARRRGHKGIWLETMEVGRAKAFYERLGFRCIGQVRLPFPGMKDELRGLDTMELGL